MTPLDVRIDGAVAWLVLNRPHRGNALDRELGDLLLAATITAANDPAVRCIVLAGEGRTFCAGDDITTLDAFLDDGDLSQVAVIPGTKDAVYVRICEALITAPKPVIAAVNGAAVGAGIELACAADIRIASDRAQLGSGLVRVGQVGTAAMLGRIVGPARATELYLTGRLVDAEEAQQIGLVHHVVPATELCADVTALATNLASAATGAIGLYKELRERIHGQSVEAALRLQDAYHVRSHALADSAEGLRAFLEHRPPAFTGR
jgi:enoyl-CoA hydratase/carnithine racemase